MSNPNLDQDFELLNIARKLNVSPERIRALYDSGLLSDVLRTENPENVDRDVFRKILGFSPFVFTVKMGGLENTDQILGSLGFQFSEWVNQKDFPLVPSMDPWEDEIEMVDPCTGIIPNEEDALQILQDRGLYRPTYEHAIRFCQQHGNSAILAEKSYAVFLHKDPQGLDSRRRIVYENHQGCRRLLYIRHNDLRLGGDSFFVGVRPRAVM
jgi:hypothetical protein